LPRRIPDEYADIESLGGSMSTASSQPAGERRTFEIGLVMAGAISAGAYTAGVVDFLLEALDQWYAVHDGNPPHDVKLRVISGASAGGMVGSILMASFGGDRLAPVRSRPAPGEHSANELYRAWVQEIDIAPLLGSKDLQKNRVLSALDCTKLRELAQHAIEVKPVTTPPLSERRPYLADPLELIVTIANLRGVPYRLGLKGGNERMTLHADYMRFAIGANTLAEPAMVLDPTDYSSEPWKLLAKAALATGAFPFALAPHGLSRPWQDYARKRWPITSYKDGKQVVEFRELIPETGDDGELYEFLSVDGGLLNNEPFDLAHSALAPATGHNERSGDKSDRAIILIAPFPSGAPAKYTPPGGLLSFGGAILNTLLEQVRFNPEVLVLAADENVYSRFLISPKRDEDFKGGNIACGALDGFGGFIHEDFRHHDFMLGRYNCQRFLKKHFTLPCDDAGGSSGRNPLFAVAELLHMHRVTPPGKQNEELPIIPCVGTAAEPLRQPDWPNYSSAKLDKLITQIDSRLMKVGELLINEHAKGFASRNLLKFAIWSQKNKTLEWLRKRVVLDLEKGHNIHVTRAATRSRASEWVPWLLAAGAIAAVVALAVTIIAP
jgi:hypothetical protein